MKNWFIWHQPLQNRWYVSENRRSGTMGFVEVVERAEYEKMLARAIKAEDRMNKAKTVAAGLLEELEKFNPGYTARLELLVTKAEAAEAGQSPAETASGAGLCGESEH